MPHKNFLGRVYREFLGLNSLVFGQTCSVNCETLYTVVYLSKRSHEFQTNQTGGTWTEFGVT